MGQKHSSSSVNIRQIKSHRGSKSSINIKVEKTLKIILQDSILRIGIYEPSVTCGWLLCETIRLYQGPGIIVALTTENNPEFLNEWLLCFEKTLKPFNNRDHIIAYFSEPISVQGIENYIIYKTIGVGNNSKTVLGRKKDTGILYATKIVDKSTVSSEYIQELINEKNVLSQLSHPFIIKLFWCFQSVRSI